MPSFNVSLVISAILVSCIQLSHGTSLAMPKGCEKKRYCEIKPPNYPELDQVVRDLQAKDFLRPSRYDEEPRERIFYDEVNCDTKVSIIRPFIIRTNATIKFVVQTSVFEQTIKQTECLHEDSRCFKGVVGLSYETSCTPTFGTIKMYLYDPRKSPENRVEYEAVSFPVCCSCSFKTTI